MNILLKITEIADKKPDRIFATLIYPDMKKINITYNKLLTDAYLTGQYLKKRCKIKKGDAVIIILKHSSELLNTFIGCMTILAIPTIIAFPNERINIEYYKDRISDLLKTSGGKVIITYPELLHELKSILKISANLKKVISPEDIFKNRNIKIAPTFIQSLNSISSEQTALLQHSSGTTGHQKGVALSHKSILNQIEHLSYALNLKKDDVIVSWLPLYHDMGLIGCFLFPLLTATKLIMISPFDWVKDPVMLLKVIGKFKGTICFLPNFSYNFLANKDKLPELSLNNIHLESIRAFINCSEPIKEKSHEIFYKRFKKYGLNKKALCTSFALAENTFAATVGGIHSKVQKDKVDLKALLEKNIAVQNKNKKDFKVFVSSGIPIKNTIVKILDKKHKEVPDRALGEVALKSDCMLTGYYNRPKITKKSFFKGWHLTGDIGYKVKNELYVIGRKKDIIIVGGKNIYPEDIELAISKLNGVHPGRVACFGVYNEEEGTEKIVVIAQLDNELKKGRIKKRIKKIVVQETGINVGDISLVDPKWLIKTSSGKISRLENKKKYLKNKENALLRR